MTKVLNVVFLGVLLMALAGGVILVRQNQETRRGAASNDNTLTVLPASGNYKKGDIIPMQINVFGGAPADTGLYRVQSFVVVAKFDQTKLKYVEKSAKVEIIELANDNTPMVDDPDAVCTIDSENRYNCTGQCVCKKIDQGSGELLFVGVNSSLTNPGIDANSKSVKIITWKMEVLADSGTANVEIDNVKSQVQVTRGETDETWTPAVANAAYTIGTVTETATLSPTAGVTETAILSPTAGAVTNTPVPIATRTPECEGAIKKCVGEVPTWCLSGKWQAMPVCGTGKVCDAGVCTDLTVEPTVKPTLALIPTVDDHALYLNLKTTMQGVAEGSKCASSWRASIILKSGVGTTMVYRNVPLVRSDVVSGIPTYNGTVKLEGWTEKTNLLVFIKGEKHMQMKYGQDNQVTAFPETVGKLTVSEGTSSPVYDFTGYPLMPGDVNQDGMINGDDFSLIKTKTQTYETVVESGEDAIFDLDGNCQLNTIDIGWLAKSLNTRQDEIY